MKGIHFINFMSEIRNNIYENGKWILLIFSLVYYAKKFAHIYCHQQMHCVYNIWYPEYVQLADVQVSLSTRSG